jgi:hypothetical protein
MFIAMCRWNGKASEILRSVAEHEEKRREEKRREEKRREEKRREEKRRGSERWTSSARQDNTASTHNLKTPHQVA